MLRILARTSDTTLSHSGSKDHSVFFSSDCYFSQDPRWAIWKTCLREVVFLSPEVSDELAHDWKALSEDESLSFLTEVLCGLHSPLLGENEVFGQFKQFVEEQRQKNNPLFAESQKWLIFLLQNVKHFRHEYGRLWGSNSYGSLLRKKIENHEDVTLFGTGHLAEEIFPWLSHKKNLQLAGRNDDRLRFFTSKYSNLSILHTGKSLSSASTKENKFHPCLVLSATLTHEQTLQLLDKWGSEVKILFDLRGLDTREEENEFREILAVKHSHIEVVFLKELFEALNHHQEQVRGKLDEVKILIKDRVHEFVHRLEHRPLGWDDLCA